MNTAEFQEAGLPAIDQIGFVVPDMDQALQEYESLFGPFERMDSPLEQVWFRGQRCDVHLELAFGQSGDMEIEFIAVRSGNSPHSEFLAAGGNGVQHLRMRVDNHDVAAEKLKALGYEAVWHHRIGDDIAFSYHQRNSETTMIELLQMPH